MINTILNIFLVVLMSTFVYWSAVDLVVYNEYFRLNDFLLTQIIV